jgi:hypothetical protein
MCDTVTATYGNLIPGQCLLVPLKMMGGIVKGGLSLGGRSTHASLLMAVA